MPTHLSPEQLRRDLALRDLTDPHEGSHALQLLVAAAVEALACWDGALRWCRGPRIVPIHDNYDDLLIGPEAVSRDHRYTRYVDGHRMLRSHSSAMIPPALRAHADDPEEDLLLVCPGLVYRRDAIDWQHTGTPHQLDIWRITRRKTMTVADLEEMTDLLVGALAPGRRYRTEPRTHPYTLEGRQVDVAAGRWMEVWECGLAHPEVLARAGLVGWSGLALGMGLDRLLMLRKGIPDIRLLRAADPRIAAQMQDLDAYRPVSAMPPIRRDLSIAVDEGDDVEGLGDRVRDALGPDAEAVEEVTVISRADYDELSPLARTRLGMVPGQHNLLVRVVLRHWDRTLSAAEANMLRDRIYAAIHQGTRSQWASG